VAGGDLHVAEADARVEHGRHEGVPEHVGVHPGHPNPSRAGEELQPAGRRVPVHPHAIGVAQDRPVVSAVDGLIDSPGYRGW